MLFYIAQSEVSSILWRSLALPVNTRTIVPTKGRENGRESPSMTNTR